MLYLFHISSVHVAGIQRCCLCVVDSEVLELCNRGNCPEAPLKKCCPGELSDLHEMLLNNTQNYVVFHH